jgi:hypothetical protein
VFWAVWCDDFRPVCAQRHAHGLVRRITHPQLVQMATKPRSLTAFTDGDRTKSRLCDRTSLE